MRPGLAPNVPMCLFIVQQAALGSLQHRARALDAESCSTEPEPNTEKKEVGFEQNYRSTLRAKQAACS